MKKWFWTERKKLNNSGSAILLVLTMVSLITILGILSLTTSAVGRQMQSLHRQSEKNFYSLENTLDEIYSGLGQTAGDAMESAYEKVLGGLYTSYKTNDEANQAFAEAYLAKLEESLGTGLNETSGDKEALAEKLKTYSAAVEKENLTLNIGEILSQSPVAGSGGEAENRYSVTLKDLCLTYVNPDTMAESSITIDLVIKTPRLRFINEKQALQDYVMVSNQSIMIEEDAGAAGDALFKGNIFGKNIQVTNTRAVMESGLVVAGEELAVSSRGSLSVKAPGTEEAGGGGSEETWDNGGISHIWAHNIKIFQGSSLEVDGGNLYVQDDTTLQQDENIFRLSGGYYGYGNKGETRDGNMNTHTDSSAILLNGKRNQVDFREADTILLAGRAYLNFRDISEAYPLGESMAVKASQSIYLVPVKAASGDGAIEIKNDDETFSVGSSNPLIFPEGKSEINLRVWKTEADGNLSESREYGLYRITRTESSGTVSYSSNLLAGDETAVIVGVKGKLYIYRSFETKEAQTEYFRRYVEKYGDTFSGYLENAGMGTAGGGTNGSIMLNGGGSFFTAASLYEVSGEGENLFRIVDNDVPTSLGIVELSNSCETSFDNLKKYLSETEKADGSSAAIPASTYARLRPAGDRAEWDMSDFEGLYEKDDEKAILVTNQDVTLDVPTGKAQAGTSYDMPYGLIITSGNVNIKGGSEQEWKGLILAGGSITISGKVNLAADGESYASYLEDERTARYFYGYSDSDASVFHNYEDFMVMANWKRGTRKHEGE